MHGVSKAYITEIRLLVKKFLFKAFPTFRNKMLLSADWVIPVANKPIEKGALFVSGTTIEKVGKKQDLTKDFPHEEVTDFGQAVILPGFVNTHTHLELSVFQGALEPSEFTPWILQLIGKTLKLSPEDWEISTRLGTFLAIKSGITCVCDVIRRGEDFSSLGESGLRGIGFIEVIEIDEAKTDETLQCLDKQVELWQKKSVGTPMKVGVSPHALYTVHPFLLKRLHKWSGENGLPFSMHLAESEEETLFIKDGTGKLASEYRQFLGWNSLPVHATGLSPIQFAEKLGILDRLIAAHCVQVTNDDISILKEHNMSVAHCPRSNAYLKVGSAPVSAFLKNHISVGLGTDSLASNEDLDFFKEMREIPLKESKGDVSGQTLTSQKIIEIATLGGARALGMEGQIGSLEKGKQADLIVLKLPKSIPLPEQLFDYCLKEAGKKNVIFTMVAGKILFYEGRVMPPDFERTATHAKKIQKKLRS